MLTELIGRPHVISLMRDAACELAVACEKEDEEEMGFKFTKLCAYGMDLDMPLSKEPLQAIVKDVVAKITPETMDTIKKAAEEEKNET